MSFNSAYCQSQIIINGQSNSFSVPLYNQTQTDFQQVTDFTDNRFLPSTSKSGPGFQPGVIITKDGDTLGGLVKYAYTVPVEKVFFKADSNGSDSVFSVHNIKSIITQFVYLARIPFKGKEEMMPWLAVGKINLYFFAKNYDNTYVLEKDRNQFVYINQKDFKVMMRHVFFDTPDMLKKIEKKEYRFEDMIKIIREYNKRFR
ncbi:MAG: hypothetical protein ABI359_09160 [Ginsengibacter sp.]